MGGISFLCWSGSALWGVRGYPMCQGFRVLAFELGLSRAEWLIIASYSVIIHLHQKLKVSWHIINQLSIISYELILLMGDFKMILDNPNFNELIEDHELSTLISEPACFNSINSTYVDNFLINTKIRFMNTLTYETGVSDHLKFIGTMLRLHLRKVNLTLRKKKLSLLQKLSSIRREMPKIGPITNNNEIIVQIFWKNPKHEHVILITSMLKI